MQGQSIGSAIGMFFEFAGSSSFLRFTHFAFVVFYGLFLLIQYFTRVYRKYGFRIFIKRTLSHFLLPFGLIVLTINTLIRYNSTEDYKYTWDHTVENIEGTATNKFVIDGKHRGMSVFGWTRNNQEHISDLVKNNIEWVAVIPFIYQNDEQSVSVRNDRRNEMWTQRDSMFINTIQELRDCNVRVHLKPHLWLGEGWRSNIKFNSEEKWNSWFDSYSSIILHYAKMAEFTGVELFCIGTELRSSVEQQPDRWNKLAREVREIYSGKLTYAANWDGEYAKVRFWDELDYVGIQAYFPLTSIKQPSLEIIKQGWDDHIETLENLHSKHKKPILFTEIGYKSESASTIQPWEWGSAISVLFKKKSTKTQQLAYEALFQKLWDRDWFAGSYIWQWDTRSSPEYAENNLNFSPRYKPAENTIAKYYGTLAE